MFRSGEQNELMILRRRALTRLATGLLTASLAIAGFGQTSLTAAKKKLRSLGYEIPEAAA